MIRVVSLLPSATEIVCFLGFEGALVGRSHECDFPPSIRDRPVLTASSVDSKQPGLAIDRQVKDLLEKGLSLYRVDAERLKSLRPDVIVTQAQCEVCAVSESELRRALQDWLGDSAEVVSLSAVSLEGLWEDFRQAGRALGVASRAEERIAELRSRMQAVAERAKRLPERPRVACLEWFDPLMAAGNWIPELVKMAGAEGIVGEPGKHSPWLDWPRLQAEDPDVLIAMPCGFSLDRTAAEMSALASRQEWRTLRAVQNERVFLVDGNQYFNRPGPRLAESLEILAEILHPHAFPPRTQGVAWKPW